MFIEITNDEREAIIARNGFKPHRAFFGWQRINHEMKADERIIMPGHKTPTGNWIIPSCCIIIEV